MPFNAITGIRFITGQSILINGGFTVAGLR